MMPTQLKPKKKTPKAMAPAKKKGPAKPKTMAQGIANKMLANY